MIAYQAMARVWRLVALYFHLVAAYLRAARAVVPAFATH